MKLKILLLCIVGFIALVGAVPVDKSEEDAEFEPPVANLDKETTVEEPAVEGPAEEELAPGESVTSSRTNI